MLNIFVKKKFLVDYLEGFIDIHNHILPGIDDGAKNVDDAIALINGFSEIGIQKFICTPHIMNNYYPNTPRTIELAYSELKDGLLQKNIKDVSIEASAEHMIDDNFEANLEQSKVMKMRKNYILIEMSYLQASINFEEAVKKIASARLFPILAHPERYVYLHSNYKKYTRYKESGILFQMNFLSLTGFYGKEVKKTAYKLLKDNLIDFMASDVHNMNQLKTLKETQLTNSQLKLVFPVIEKTINNFF